MDKKKYIFFIKSAGRRRAKVQVETFATYQKKQIRIVLDFPEQSDKKAEQEFIRGLKELYLRKIPKEVMQNE